MPAEMLKALPAAAKKVYEDAYGSYKAKGLSDEEAARRAWGAVKKGWHKSKDGKWVKNMESYIFENSSDEPFQVKDAVTDTGGKLFRKALISLGTWSDPNLGDEEFVVTPERIQGWMSNFYARRPALVTVPIGHEGYGDALRNTGYVRDLEFDGTVLWGFIEFTSPEAAKLAEEGSIPAVSLGIVNDYLDPKDGKEYGEAIYHVALTQSPWIEGMAGFQTLGMVPKDASVTLMSRMPDEKESGHKSPPKGYPEDRSQYADPANFKFPIDSKHLGSSIAAFRTAVENEEYSEPELRSIAKRIAMSFHRIRGRDVDDDTLVAQYAGVNVKKKKETSHMDELEQAKSKVTELEKKLTETETSAKSEREALTKELDALRAKAKSSRTERNKQFASALVGGKLLGAKFGLPGTATEQSILTLLDLVDVDDPVTFEFEIKQGDKVEKVQRTGRELLVGLLEAIVKDGVVPVKELTKQEDKKPEGGPEAGAFLARQQKRKGIKTEEGGS